MNILNLSIGGYTVKKRHPMKTATTTPATQTATGRRYTVIESATFVETWMKSQSLEEVASTFSITEQAASAKAANLRKRGVKLPRMERRYNEVETLNKLIDKLGK